MSDKLLNCTIEKNVNFSNDLLVVFCHWSEFHKIIKNWIISKSTQNGPLKNVQDGISRPLGSREKKKVYTVLPDTL